MSEPQRPSLTIKRKIKATPEEVFNAWVNAETLTKWFGPGAIRVVSAESDAQPGGRYRIVMRAPDGEMHDVSGTYRDVEPNTKLSFTWAWATTPERESFVTLTFEETSDGTLLTLHHEKFFDEAARDHHHQGWTGCFDRLEQLANEGL